MGLFGGPKLAARCAEQTCLTYPELVFFLDTVPAEDCQAEWQRCVLQRGHPAEHTAGIAKHESQGEDAWWLLWETDGHRCTELAHCPAYRATHPDFDICQLPAGHWGHHSWLLAD
ncbi:hypothetical protein [Catellatospora sp. NPDC049609]|uniref:hypothetical protein n=1 Tax=Catellatospora sp. NPDC049609 TaxID=3155505 RepID=UPI00342FD223